MAGPPPPAFEAMMRLIAGKQMAMMLEVAADLNVAEHLKNGPLPSDEIAKRVGAHPDRLYRLLRGLTNAQVFEERPDRVFALSPNAELLLDDHPLSVRGMACWVAGPFHSRAWCELGHAVRTGDIAFDHAFGESFFEHTEKNPADLKVFQAAMSSLTKSAPAIVAVHDWKPYKRICDLGGGRGDLLVHILGAAPEATGVVFEMPHVAEVAAPYVKASTVAARASVEAGDFFAGCPSGFDAYVMKFILHDHDDEKCKTILKHCRAGLNAGGRVIVIDHLVPPPGVPGFAKLIDVEMFAMVTGRERTEAEFAALFSSVGLQLVKATPTPPGPCVIEAKAV